jgi:hypothetical protein
VAPAAGNRPSWATDKADISTDCIGTSSNPLTTPLSLTVEAGTDSTVREPVRYLESVYVVGAKFDSVPAIRLIDSAGRVKSIGSGKNVNLPIETSLAPGNYVVEATAGTKVGRDHITIAPPAEVELLVRQDQRSFDLVGAMASQNLAMYQEQTSGCHTWWAFWQAVGPQPTVNGNAIVKVAASSGTPKATYCIMAPPQGIVAACEHQAFSF